MPAKSTTFANELLQHIFLNQPITLVGDAGGLLPSAVAGSLYFSLHTADPSAGDQSTGETTYGGYARQGLVRTGAGWTVAGSTASNVAQVTFPVNTLGTPAITYVGIGTDAAGAGKLLYYTAIVATPVGVGDQPFIAPGACTVTES
jgi:hypothetical protein